MRVVKTRQLLPHRPRRVGAAGIAALILVMCPSGVAAIAGGTADKADSCPSGQTLIQYHGNYESTKNGVRGWAPNIEVGQTCAGLIEFAKGYFCNGNYGKEFGPSDNAENCGKEVEATIRKDCNSIKKNQKYACLSKPHDAVPAFHASDERQPEKATKGGKVPVPDRVKKSGVAPDTSDYTPIPGACRITGTC
jgi:hypothetical protein